MAARFVHSRRLKLMWLTSLAVPAILQIGLAGLWPDLGGTPAPRLLFGLVVVLASLCAIVSVMVLARADHNDEAELGYLGTFFLTMSILPLVHGLTTPGVIYGENVATASSAFWSIPLALCLALPALMPRTRAARLDQVWRTWITFARAGIFVLGASLLIWTSLLPGPEPGTRWTTAVAIFSFAGCVALSVRHLRLAMIAQRSEPLVIAAGYGLVGSSAFMWIGSTPYSVGFWVAHLLDVAGVFLGVIGTLRVYRSNASIRSTFDPILAIDPRSALELGLEPVVHDFIRDLEEKDALTRDHVVRTAELAIVAGEKLGLRAHELRELGLAALLHDIGKLEIPDVVLNKPGKLTDTEYEIIKRHADYGANLVESTRTLASIAPTVRAHHERMDGRGYPVGLIGSQIPLNARIVSVCDAFDAMANTRQYRDGMGVERAIEVLEHHAGSQWDRRVVDTVVRIVRAAPPASTPAHFDQLGRIGCDCVPEEFGFGVAA